MNLLNNMSVAGKLRLIASIVLVLMIGLGAASLWQMSKMDQQTEQIIKYRIVGIKDAGHMQYVAARLRTRQYRLAVSQPEQLEASIASYQKAVDEFDEASRIYATSILDNEERKVFDEAVSVWKNYLEISSGYMTAIKAGDREGAIKKVTGHSKDFDAVVAATNALTKFNIDGASADALHAEETYGTAKVIVIVGVAVSALLAFGLTLVIARSISVPLDKAVELAEKVAKGDLTSDVKYQGKDETAKLLAALKRMNDSLVTIVTQVRNGSDSIATGSAEIATGNVDLSQRTEEQAANLEETAASMEQMNATVRNNADTARQANDLAIQASATAQKGGVVVGQVVATMTQINDSSKKIADIIGVIEGIAFQTNILALNAAVEAARAGAEGRGFAVVATEVRSLAGKSSEAARAIKQLITESVEKVEAGTNFVSQAHTTMDQIVSQVTRVADMITEISASSAEQTTGISQVSEAVQQLDQVTQQNAALVEESAAAAESLRVQASSLADTVSVFKLK